MSMYMLDFLIRAWLERLMLHILEDLFLSEDCDNYIVIQTSITVTRGGSRSAEIFLQESILIGFDYLWKVLHSDKNFATPWDPPLVTVTGIYLIKVNLKEFIKIEGNSVISIIFHSIFGSEIRSHLTCNSWEVMKLLDIVYFLCL